MGRRCSVIKTKNLRENDNHKCGRRFVRNAYPTICQQLLRFVSFQLFQGFATSLRTWPAVLWKTKTWHRTKSQQIWTECCAAPKAVKLVLAYFLNFEFFWICRHEANDEFRASMLWKSLPNTCFFFSEATLRMKATQQFVARWGHPSTSRRSRRRQQQAQGGRANEQWQQKRSFFCFFISYISCL